MDIAGAMSAFVGYVWSTPTAIFLAGAGIFFTILMRGIQFRAVTHGFAVLRGKYDNPNDAGNISHFQALCAALSGTIGLGNIAGVAVGISTGGPGAVFWMWVVGFLGMATKFTTCSLATMYRRKDSSGTYRGGPMYYIEMGLGQSGPKWKRAGAKALAILFAFLGVCGCIGAGTMFQSNQAAKTFVNLFKKVASGGVSESSQFVIQMTVGVILCIGVGLVIIGGIKRIGLVAGRLVPAMCVIYVLGSLFIIIKNLEQIPQIFSSIFSNAFSPAAGMGAFYGVAVRTAMVQGVRRACFSNEAGMGTAPIAHATAKTNEPIREGVVAALGPLIDTLIICTMTALVLLGTGTHTRQAVGTILSVGPVQTIQSEETATIQMEVHIVISDPSVAKVGEELFVHRSPAVEGEASGTLILGIESVEANQVTVLLSYDAGPDGREAADGDRRLLPPGTQTYLFRSGVELSALAFDRGFAGFGTYFIPVAALLFAFSTMISWGFYGETCTEYLFGERAVLPFKIAFVSMILVGTASMKLQPVLDWADGMLGLMMVPNLIGTVFLAPHVARAARDYFRRLTAGEFDEQIRR